MITHATKIWTDGNNLMSKWIPLQNSTGKQSTTTTDHTSISLLPPSGVYGISFLEFSKQHDHKIPVSKTLPIISFPFIHSLSQAQPRNTTQSKGGAVCVCVCSHFTTTFNNDNMTSTTTSKSFLTSQSTSPTTYESIGRSQTTTRATTSSFGDDVNGGGGSNDFRALKKYSDPYLHEEEQALMTTQEGQSSHDDDQDGTFLKGDWLDIPSSTLPSWPFSRIANWCCADHLPIERNAVHFGIRMSVLLTISSMFVFFEFKEGMWVLITVLFVCWFPRLDSASVVEKSIQRLIGTFIGAALALTCGFISLWCFDTVPSNEDDDGVDRDEHSRQKAYQAAFLATCIFVVTLTVGFAILQFKIQGTPIIQKYNYASILCLLTFTIGIFPFYDGDDPRWLRALYRVQNVIIGCILGAFGSMVLLPKSTNQILTEQIHRQIRLAGEVSEAVLHEAADSFSGAFECINLADELLETPQQKSQRLAKQSSRVSFRFVKKSAIYVRGDQVLETYEAALKDWRVTKGIFSILAYDPFNIGIPEETQAAFKAETANTLARALRIQTTVVLLDGIIRNDPKHSFSDDDLELFADSGTLMQHMLSIPLNKYRSEDAACALTEKLHLIRHMIVTNSARVASSSDRELPSVNSRENFHLLVNDDQNLDSKGRGVPTFVKGSNVCALLFLQLVEHLILRSLRLYNSWKKVEDINSDIVKVQNNKLL
jgi:hypothetical protein